MTSPSIRRTLLIRCGLGVGVLLCLLSVGVYLLVKQSLYRELDDSVFQTAALLANQVELEDEEITYEWKEGIGTNQALVEDGFFQFWDETTGITTRSPGLHSNDLPRFTGKNGAPRIRSIRLPNGDRARSIGLRVYPFVLPHEIQRMTERGKVIDPKTLPHILVVARNSEPVHHTLARVRWILAGGSGLTLMLGFLVIDRVIRVSLRPIDNLTSQMRDRAAHQLDSALEVPGALPSELAGLAKNFDLLLSRVAAIRQRERDFIRHAAHELRTPIAGLRATTDLALSQNRDATAYADHLATCQKTAVELGQLVSGLSALSRIGQEATPPLLEPVDVWQLLVSCADPMPPHFHERGLQLKLNPPHEALIANADPTLIRIIFTNLLDNAISYAPRESEIQVRYESHKDRVAVAISNKCENAPEDLERLFEPLFRQQSSRNDGGSHLGIGLTLSLEAARAMGGTLQAKRIQEGWIEFVLTMPTPGLRKTQG